MAQIALYIAGYELQSLDVSCESKFKESFRGLFRQTGLEGKALSIIITVSVNATQILTSPPNSNCLLFPFVCTIKAVHFMITYYVNVTLCRRKI